MDENLFTDGTTMKRTLQSGQRVSSLLGSVMVSDAMMLALEPRVLFDGALAATTKDLLDDLTPHTVVNMEAPGDGVDRNWSPVLDQLAVSGGSLMIIDTGVAGWEQLLAAVTKGTEVVLLDPERDGVAQITELLAGRTQLESLHIVSHGRAGEILLGSSRLTLDTLEAHSDVLATWGSALAQDGDILIYGCDVGAGSRGEAFVQALSTLTGADVAVSSDATGAVTLGGDWDLEVRQGDVRVENPFATTTVTSFQGLLAAPTAVPGVQDHGITLDGSNDWVNIPDQAQGKTPLNNTEGTISLWFNISDSYPTTAGKFGFIFSNTSDNASGIDSIFAYVKSSGIADPVGGRRWSLSVGMDGLGVIDAIVRAGEWHHTVITWKAGKGYLFLDGQQVKSYDVDFPSLAGFNSKVSIGAFGDNSISSVKFPGSIAEVRLWNTGLTLAAAPTWVRSDMTTASLTGAEAGLTGYYPLNDGVANPATTTALDTKGGNNGTLTGGPVWITRPVEGSSGITVALGGSDADDPTNASAGNNATLTKSTLTSIPNATTVGTLYLPSDVTFSNPLTVGSQILTTDDPLRQVKFVPVTDFDGTASWTFTVNDGTSDSAPATVSIAMKPVQDAPTLTAVAPVLTAIDENATANAGQTIASFAGASITDVDTSPTSSEGIAITALNSGYGTWQYDTGSGWTAVGAVSGTSALLLRDTDQIRYVPDGLHGESVGLTYRAWDQTSGTAGNKVDVSSHGGATAFSTNTDTATLTVTEVIDTPQVVIGTGDQLVFDGNNDTITSPTFVFPTTAWTIEMWWKPTVTLTSASARQDLLFCNGATGRPHISFNKNGGGEIGIFTKIGGPSYDTAVSTTTSWTAGVWYHLAFTFDGTNTRVIVNGQLEKQVSQPGIHEAQTGFYLGARSNLLNDMKGGLADVRIWNTAQSSANIVTNMSRTLTGAEAGLVGYWPLNEGVGAVVNDRAGAKNGTITGATWNTSADGVWGLEEQDIAIPGLSLTDIDATGNETVTLTVAHGTLTVDTTVAGGVGAAGVTGNGTGAVTLVGTLAQLNATLAGTNALVYRGSLNFNGTDSLAIGVTDSTGGTVAGTVAITVYNVYDPLAVTAGGALVFTEGAAATAADAGLTIANEDGANLTGAQVSITAGYVAGQDVLNFVNTGAITGTWNAGTGVLSLTGTTTTANYQTALQSITYNNAGGDNPTAGVRTLAWKVTSALGTSPANTSTVTVQAVNDRPVMTASATLNYLENGAAAIIDATLTVADADNTTIQSATVTFSSNFVVGEDRLVFVNQSGISGSWDGATGVLTLSGPATLTNYRNALRSVRYINDNTTAPQASTRQVQFSVYDGGLSSDPVSVNVTVTAVNDPPVITLPAPGTVNEDQSLSLTGISVADVDIAGGNIQLALAVNNGIIHLATTAGLSFSAGANGSATMTFWGTVAQVNNALNGMTYQPDDDYFGAETLAIVANDLGGSGSGGAKSAAASLGITVTAVQDAPVASIDSISAFEDIPKIITIATDLLANDIDVDGDLFTLVSFTNPSHGTLVDNGNGTLTYLSSSNYHGNDSFNYTVNDGHGNTSQSVVTMVVNDIPDSLQANSDTATTDEEVATSFWVLDNDRDPDFLPLGLNPARAVIGFTDPAHGQVTYQGNGQFIYTPDHDYAGADSFTYTLSVGDARTDVGTVNITVNPVNDSPMVAVNTGAAVVEGAAVTITPVFLQIADVEQAAAQVIVTLVNTPDYGSLTLNGVALVAGQTWTQDDMNQNRLVYSHDGSETLADSFSFTAADGVGGSLLETTFNLTVIPANDNPVLVKNGVTVAEGGDVTIGSGNLAATDVEDTAAQLTYVLDGLPSQGSVLLNGVALGLGGQFTQVDVDSGNLVYRHDGSETLADSFSFHITDSQGGTLATTALPITITAANDAPVWSLPGAQSINEDVDTDITGVSFSDSDLGGGNASVTATVAHGILTLSSVAGLTFDAGGNGTATWTVSGSAANVNAALAHILYRGQANFNGADSLVLVVSDGGGSGAGGAKVAVANVAITVQPVNDNPIVGADGFVTAESASVTLDIAGDLMINDTDPDGGALTFSSFAQPAHGTVTQVGATLVYAPVALYNGLDQFTYTIVNSRGDSVTATVSMTVAPVENALTPADDAVTLVEDGSVTTGNVLANDRDPDFLPDGINPALAIIGFTPAAFGTVTYLGGGQFHYIPDADFNGIEVISYTLSAGDLRTGTGDITFTVTAINDDPTLPINTGLSLNEGGQVVLTNLMLLGQDLEQSSTQVQFILATAPSHGTLALSGTALAVGAIFSQDDIDNHRVVYTHDGGESVSDPFVLTVMDGVGGFLLNQTVAVTVAAVNDAPQLSVNTGLTVAEGGSGVITSAALTMTDAESGNNAIVYSLTAVGSHGQVRLNGAALSVGQTFTEGHLAASKVDYLHDGGETLTDEFRFTVSDSQGGSFGETPFVITVTPVNDPLVVTAGGALVFTEGDATLVASSSMAVSDPDGTDLIGAQVAIVGGFSTGEDVLGIVNTASILGAWDAGTGILTLSGVASMADYQTALGSVTYHNAAGDNPTAGMRTLAWKGIDTLGTGPASQSLITVVAVNDRPGLAGGTAFTYSENDVATLIDPNLTLSDADSTTLQGATVSISSNYVAAEDRLVFTNQLGISGSWDGVAGVMTLSGSASVADYQTALRSVRYINDNGDTPQSSLRQVDFSVHDGSLSSTVVSSSITVVAVNDPPVVTVSGPRVVGEDLMLILAGMNVTDADLGAGDIQLSLGVNHGIVDLGTTVGLNFSLGADGSATMIFSGSLAAINDALNGMFYEPDADYVGADSFTLVANDLGGSGSGGAKSTAAAVAITVNPVQDTPVANADAILAQEDVTKIITIAGDLLANDGDVDGDLLTFISFTNPSHGVLVNNGNGTLSYLSSNDYHGVDAFTYTIDDGHGNTDVGTVTVVVNPIPDSLVADNDSASTGEDTAVTLSVLDNDLDPDFLPNGLNPALNVIGFSNPAHGQAVYLGTGQLVYTPDPNYFGTDTLTYTLNAGDARIDVGTVTITVTPQNDAPMMAAPAGGPVLEGGTLVITAAMLPVSDPEQSASQVTVTLVNAPIHGRLERDGQVLSPGQTWTQEMIQQGRLLYRHDGSETSADSFSFTATDGVGGTMLETNFGVTVTAVNDNPVVTQGAVSVTEGGQVVMDGAILSATDTEGGAAPLGYVLDSLPVHGYLVFHGITLGLGGGVFTQADVNAGGLVYVHDGSETTGDSFSFHITDPQGGATPVTVQGITIIPGNDPPVWSLPGAWSGNEDQNLDITGVQISDSDLGVGVIQVSLSVSHGTVTLPVTTALTSSAGANGSGSWTFFGSVASVNAALNHIVYRGNANFNGSDQLVLVADDGGLSGVGGAKVAIGSVGITVQATADNPNAGLDAFSTAEDIALTLDIASAILANDFDPDGLSFSLESATQPAHGTVTLSGSNLIYTPAAHYNGLDSFTYTIINSNGGRASSTVSVVVNPLADQLRPGDDQVTVVEDGMVVTDNLLANDRDPDYLPDGRNPALRIIGFSAAAHGSLTWNGDGRFTYVPEADFDGYDHFSYTLSAGDQRMDTVWVVVTVTAANDNPSLVTNTGLDLDEGGQVTLTPAMLKALDLEQGPSQIQFIVASVPTHGVLTLHGVSLSRGSLFSQDDIDNHRVVYSHGGDESTNDSFLVSITDDAGGYLLSQPILIRVTPVNDAPQLLTNAGLTVAEGGRVALSTAGLLVTDAESHSGEIFYDVSTIPVHGQLRLNGAALDPGQRFSQADLMAGRVEYLHDGSDTVTDGFTFTVSDGQGGRLAQTPFTITITPVNEPPVLTAPGWFTVLEDESTPLRGIWVSDADIGSGMILVRLSVEHGRLSVPELAGLQFHNGRNHTASMTLVGPVDIVNRALMGLHYQGVWDYNGYDRLALLVSDQGNDGTVSAATTGKTVVLEVTPVEDSPLPGMDAILSPPDHPFVADEPVVIDVGPSLLANDYDGDATGLTISGFTQPQFGSLVDQGHGRFVYTPNANFKGYDQFTYTVTDITGKYAFTTVVIINPVMDGLDAGDDTLVAYEDEPGQTINLLLNDRDPDFKGGTNPKLTIIAFTQGAHGRVVYVGNQSFLYIPNPDFNGKDRFTYTLNAGDRRIDVATVQVTVRPVNDQPNIAVNSALTLIQGGDAIIGMRNLSVWDVDNVDSELVYLLERLPEHGQLLLSGEVLRVGGHFTQADINKGNLVYRHNDDTANNDRFRFSVDDSAGGFALTTDFLIQITPKPVTLHAPSFRGERPFPVAVMPSSGTERNLSVTPRYGSSLTQSAGFERFWWERLGQRLEEGYASPAPSGSIGLMGMDVEYSSSPILTVIRAHQRSIAIEASGTPLLTAVMNANPGVEEGGVVTPVLNAIKRAGRSMAPGASITPVLTAVVAGRPEGSPHQLDRTVSDHGSDFGVFGPGFSFMPWFPEKKLEPGAPEDPEGSIPGDSEGIIRGDEGEFLVPMEGEGWDTLHPVPQPTPKPVSRPMRLELSEQFNQLVHDRHRKADQFMRAFG
ncbi:MAG: tandem-95 repeat protein [Magnetococcales bacterium]|nr:tandem-95 repeat protein [Magnetococcales bacterium]